MPLQNYYQNQSNNGDEQLEYPEFFLKARDLYEIDDDKENIQLHIKKYVSDSLTGTWHDDSMVLENGKTAYFKIVVS